MLLESKTMIKETSIPFYLMTSNEKPNSNPAEYPADSNTEISGLQEAIRNTEKGIADGKYDRLELDQHLEGLRRQLVKAIENKKRKEKR